MRVHHASWQRYSAVCLIASNMSGVTSTSRPVAAIEAGVVARVAARLRSGDNRWSSIDGSDGHRVGTCAAPPIRASMDCHVLDAGRVKHRLDVAIHPLEPPRIARLAVLVGDRRQSGHDRQHDTSLRRRTGSHHPCRARPVPAGPLPTAGRGASSSRCRDCRGHERSSQTVSEPLPTRCRSLTVTGQDQGHAHLYSCNGDGLGGP